MGAVDKAVHWCKGWEGTRRRSTLWVREAGCRMVSALSCSCCMLCQQQFPFKPTHQVAFYILFLTCKLLLNTSKTQKFPKHINKVCLRWYPLKTPKEICCHLHNLKSLFFKQSSFPGIQFFPRENQHRFWGCQHAAVHSTSVGFSSVSWNSPSLLKVFYSLQHWKKEEKKKSLHNCIIFVFLKTH